MARIRLNPNPPLPGWTREYLENADSYPYTPAYTGWISARGAPATTTVNVAYGQASVDLDLHFGGVVGFGPSDVLEARSRVERATVTPPGTITGLAGGVMTLNFAPQNDVPGTYRQATRGFTFAPDGGFTQDADYVINVTTKSMNRFRSPTGDYFICVHPPSNGIRRAPWNYAACPDFTTPFTIAIRVPPRPVDIGSCTVGVSSTSLNPGQAFTASFSARNAGTNGGFPWPVNNGLPARYRLEYSGNMPGVGSVQEIQGSGVSQTGFGPILFPGTTTNWPPPSIAAFTAPTALGSYTFSWRIFGFNSLDGPHYVGTPCSVTIDVVERPYHQVFGGDTRVGSGFMNGGTCATAPGARIIGWNRDGTPNFTGAGSQLAAFAFDTINFFASGQLRPTITTNPKPLSFANANPSRSNIGASAYGGGLMDGYAVCAPNHYDDGVAEATSPLGGSTSANIAADIYRRGSQATPANLTITGGNLGLGTGSRIVYVYGDVTITNNITYAGGNYNDVDNIPGFRLIVRGNIYVEPGVTQLDGIYIAQPLPDGTRGRFYTCAPGGAPPDLAEMEGVCRTNKLTIYGAVLADLIKLTRSRGNVNQATNTALLPSQDAVNSNAAEVIIMTPEAWLVSDFTGNAGFDKVSTLPPVL